MAYFYCLCALHKPLHNSLYFMGQYQKQSKKKRKISPIGSFSKFAKFVTYLEYLFSQAKVLKPRFKLQIVLTYHIDAPCADNELHLELS